MTGVREWSAYKKKKSAVSFSPVYQMQIRIDIRMRSKGQKYEVRKHEQIK